MPFSTAINRHSLYVLCEQVEDLCRGQHEVVYRAKGYMMFVFPLGKGIEKVCVCKKEMPVLEFQKFAANKTEKNELFSAAQEEWQLAKEEDKEATSDEEEESDDERDLIYVEDEEEEEVDVDHEDIGFRVTKSDYFHDFEEKSNSRLSAKVFQVEDTSYSPITSTLP